MPKSRKRRFGVSVPADLAGDLDRLAEMLGVDRSRLVEQALRSHVHDYLYLLVPHSCMGILVVTRTPGASMEEFFRVVAEYRDVIRIYSHLHVEEACVETMIVSGSSERIRGLYRRLEEVGYHARYIPLDYRGVSPASSSAPR